MDIQKSILAILDKKEKIIGTGFLAADGLILTCAHVVEQARAGLNDQVTVRFAADRSDAVARVEQYSSSYDGSDVALLRVDSAPDGLAPLPLGDAAGSAGHDFYAYGYATVTDVQGIGARGKIVDIVDDGRLVQLTSQEPDHGMSGGPVLDEQRRVVIGMVTKGKGRLEKDQNLRNTQTTFATSLKVIREICSELRLTEICPYRSLDVFNEEDAPFFFGREKVVQKLIDSLKREPRFLAVLGPSGSGKSSVVRAGLIPALRQGKVPGSQKWEIITIRPANDPFEQLEVVGFISPQTGLESFVTTWLADHPDKTRLVLFVDQFEEVLFATPKDIQLEFVANLSKLLNSSLAITLVLTLRDDFYSRLIQDANTLTIWLERGLVNTPLILERDELFAMIVEPAKLTGLTFDDGLVDIIIDDACETDTSTGIARSTILPLLEFSLTQLWELRQDKYLIYKAYKMIGKITGSLSQWADLAYSALSSEHQLIARDILTRLVRLGNAGEEVIMATRKRLNMQELGEDPTILTIVKHFVDYRLISSVSDDKNVHYIEYIHDAVVHEWKLLNQLLHKDQNFLVWRQTLQDAIRVWYSHQQDQGDLFRGIRLQESEKWFSEYKHALTAPEQEFLQESIALRNREMEKSEQIRQVEQYAQQKMEEEAEISRRMADPEEREASKWKTALAKHQNDFYQYGTLLNPDELTLLEMQINNPKLVLEDEDSHLILYSATSCDRGHQWLALLGEHWLDFIRQTCLNDECPQPVRLGAAAFLGERNDQPAIENLRLVLEKAKNKDQKSVLIDLLAQFLAKSSKNWPLTWTEKRTVFRHTTRLRIEAGKPERVRMSKVAIVLAFVSTLISYPTIIFAALQLNVQESLSTKLPQDNISIVLGYGMFWLLGLTISLALAYVFAESMTSIDIATQTWKRPWRMLIMGGFGSLVGTLLFLVISGQPEIMWFTGGLIGLTLALLPSMPKKQPRLLCFLLALALSFKMRYEPEVVGAVAGKSTANHIIHAAA